MSHTDQSSLRLIAAWAKSALALEAADNSPNPTVILLLQSIRDELIQPKPMEPAMSLSHARLSYLAMSARSADAHINCAMNQAALGHGPQSAEHLRAAHGELVQMLAEMAAMRLELERIGDVLPSRGILASNLPQIAAE